MGDAAVLDLQIRRLPVGEGGAVSQNSFVSVMEPVSTGLAAVG